MKNLLSILFVIVLLQSCATDSTEKKVNQAPEAAEAIQTKAPGKMLRHVVMFKFKDEASEAEVKTVTDAFADLKNHIPEIKDFEWGTNNSPEGLNEGLTHCFLVTFDSEEGRKVYLPHPKHLEFVEVLKPHLDKVTVIDYWAAN